MAELLYVVHRYAPYPGGSEVNTQRYAEASVALGHDVTVLAITHQGDYNGVKVTSDPAVLQKPWDMVIVHGDGPAQNLVHFHGANGPIMYLLIKPFENAAVNAGLARATWVGCATSYDVQFVEQKGFGNKKHFIKYAIPVVESHPAARLDLQEHYGITIAPNRKIVVSCGGFWPHKGFNELANVFSSIPLLNSSLIMTGYDVTGLDKSINIPHVQQVLCTSPKPVYDLLSLADLYVLNSTDEGYGLVLLEAMMMGANWVARPVGGAPDLAKRGLGRIYNTPEELGQILRELDMSRNGHDPANQAAKTRRESYVRVNHNPEKVTRDMLSVGVK